MKKGKKRLIKVKSKVGFDLSGTESSKQERKSVSFVKRKRRTSLMGIRPSLLSTE